MDSDKCELCGAMEKLQRHHLVPKSVLRALPPRPQGWFTNPTIIVCDICHKKIHESFLDHLRRSGKVEGLEDVDAFAVIKYQLIKRFLKEKHPGMYKEWRIFLDEFTESVFTEMEKEE
jgi:hypothetical protein